MKSASELSDAEVISAIRGLLVRLYPGEIIVDDSGEPTVFEEQKLDGTKVTYLRRGNSRHVNMFDRLVSVACETSKREADGRLAEKIAGRGNPDGKPPISKL